jgi:hypothetical protein
VIKPIDNTSSSEVRTLIVQNRIEEANIDSFVAKYIQKNSLYIAPTGVVAEKKEADYKKVFSEYIRELKKSKPELDLKNITLPKYLPEQSAAAWPTKFTNLIMENEKMVGKPAEDFRDYSLKTFNDLLVYPARDIRLTKIVNPCDPIQLIQLFPIN